MMQRKKRIGNLPIFKKRNDVINDKEVFEREK